jgi:hypothetical protein
LSENISKVVKSVEVNLNRNIQGFPLCAGMTKEKRLEIMNLVQTVIDQF